MDDPWLLFIGACISGFVGLFFLVVNDEIKDRKEKWNISKPFLLEMDSIESKIRPILTAYYLMNPTVGHPFLLANLLSKIKEDDRDYNLNKDFPLYPKYGAYYIFQHDIIKFDHETLKKMYEFYNNLITADNRLINYYNLSSTNKDIMQSYELQDDFFNILIKADSEISALKTQLKTFQVHRYLLFILRKVTNAWNLI